MKKNSKLIRGLLISGLVFALIGVGCQQVEPKPTDEPKPVVEQKPVVDPKPEARYIQKTATDPKGNEKWTELATYINDLDGDGTEEEIALVTSAERDSKGNMMWDDGQKWLLSVKDGGDYYPLYQEYVQIGSVYFTVAGYENSPIPKITAFVSTGAGLIITNYVFEPEKKGFRVEPVYDSQAINLQFTSLTGYD